MEGLHRRIAAAIKSARANRSAQWLADETERLGYPISRAAIANYESGRKKGLDVAELLVLAAALRIPPLTLLFPQLPDGPVELLPGVETTSWDAAAWFSGEASSPDPDRRPLAYIKGIRTSPRCSRPPQPATRDGAVLRVRRPVGSHRRRQKRPITPRDPEVRAFTEQLQTLKQEITRLDEVIRENGGVIDDK